MTRKNAGNRGKGEHSDRKIDHGGPGAGPGVMGPGAGEMRIMGRIWGGK